MPETKKLSQEQIDKINEVRISYNELINIFGQIEFDIVLADQHLQQLRGSKTEVSAKLTAVIEREQKLVDELNTEYGSGVVNIEDGTFTPNE
jgi:hypothetical protein